MWKRRWRATTTTVCSPERWLPSARARVLRRKTTLVVLLVASVTLARSTRRPTSRFRRLRARSIGIACASYPEARTKTNESRTAPKKQNQDKTRESLKCSNGPSSSKRNVCTESDPCMCACSRSQLQRFGRAPRGRLRTRTRSTLSRSNRRIRAAASLTSDPFKVGPFRTVEPPAPLRFCYSFGGLN